MAARLPRTITALVLAGALVVAGAPFAPSAAAYQPSVTIEGGGWGHGVGMSQYGANGQAKAGRTYQQILSHYYQGISIGPGGPWGDVQVLIGSGPSSIEIVPKAATSLQILRPDQSVLSTTPVAADDKVRMGTANGLLFVTRNGTAVSGSPFSAGHRGRLVVPSQRVVVRPDSPSQFLGWQGSETTREYRYGAIEASVSPGLDSCAAGHLCTVVRDMSMQEYLFGVAEMPNSFELQALKAQALAARSFAANRVTSPRASGVFQLRADVFDQVYRGWGYQASAPKWVTAVGETANEVIRHNGQIITAYYFSTSGGHTENSEYVWQATVPYARAVADPWDVGSPRHSWSRTYTLAEIGSWFGVSNVRDVRLSGNVGTSGRIDKATVSIIGATTKTVTGNQFRATVNQNVPADRVLWSTKFRILGAGGFPDVPPNAYYAPGVAWLASEGITTGYGNTGRYEPDIAVTRGQMAAFLWRVMGSPHSGTPHGFPDVPPGAFYEAAVRWLTANGITDGYGTTGRFEPDIAVNRAQMATFLHRLAGLTAPTSAHGFPDVVAGSYYERAVSWAVQHGITDGYGTTGRFEPDIVVSRAQMAAFLFRLASRSAAWSGPLPPTAP